MRSLLFFASALSLTFAAAGAARADVPGPRTVCDADGLGCTVCWEGYGDPADAGPWATCSAEATAKGLVDACQDRQGGGDNHYFCPKGVTVGTTTTGCSIGAAPASSIAIGALAALDLLAARRRARRR